jgi:PAS domain S-box-containing protein
MSKNKLNTALLIFSSVLIVFIFVIKTLVLLKIIECTDFVNYIEYFILIGMALPFYLVVLKYVSNKKIENKQLRQSLSDIEALINHAALISKADSEGKITYVNKKFSDTSGYSETELLGKDHNIVNSGKHDNTFWTTMYETTIVDKNVWHNIVTNKAKDGSLYWVDTYIKANFNSTDESLVGFTSIRQDITPLVKTLEQLNKKEREISDVIEAINASSAVLEFCPEGKIINANDNFINIFKCTRESILTQHHDIFVANAQINNKNHEKFWLDLKQGKSKSGEFIRYRHDGSHVWVQATYSPILDDNGVPYKIMMIMTDITDSVKQREELNKKNVYLEHAAKILRHDMHSGINTYIPKGISSLERRLNNDVIKELKLEVPLRLIKDGLEHAQKVYAGVKEFTNLVKKDATLNKTTYNLKDILRDYLAKTSYGKQVIIDDLPTIAVNEPLFCTAIDNLIRNGLKYNDSSTKFVHISAERNGTLITIQDNGRGMTQKDFKYLSQPYARKHGQNESGTGLGLNICVAILKEHGFSLSCEKNKIGTKIKIKLK